MPASESGYDVIMPRARKKKSKRMNKSNVVEVDIQKESFLSMLSRDSLGQFIIIFVVGWAYIFIWMNTPYYDPSKELFSQPNLLIAYIPPWIAVFCYMLYEKIKPDDMIGGRILTHVISVFVISLFVVGCSFGMMMIGLILIGLVAVIFGLV